MGRESVEAGAAALELAREALADGEAKDAAKLAREALAAGVGEVDARLVLVEALAATDPAAAATAIDETLSAWLEPDPRVVPVGAWDALLALIDRAGSARAKAATAGDDSF